MSLRRSPKRRPRRAPKRLPTKPRRQQGPEPPAEPPPGSTARIVHNECWGRVADTNAREVLDAVRQLLRFRPEGYHFMPAYKNTKWDGYVSLYRKRARTFPGGLVDRTVAKLEELGVEVSVKDVSQPPQKEPWLAGGTNSTELRPYQKEAVQGAESVKGGVLEAATGLGKTEIMGEVIRQQECRALIMVASASLARQTIKRFKESLDFPAAPPTGLYGIVGDDVDEPGLITIALYQTLHRRLMPVCVRCGRMGELERQSCGARVKRGEKMIYCGGALDFSETDKVLEWLASFDSLHLDEAHRAPAKTWWPIVNSCPAARRYGYSATAFKSDIATELKLVGATGEIFYSFAAKEAVEEGWLVKPVVTMVTPHFPPLVDEELYIDSYREGIVDHRGRNNLITDIACGVAKDWGLPTLILVQWLDHGKSIRHGLRELGVRVEFLSGSATTDEREAAMKALGDGSIKCLISTTIFDEGVDIPEIGALILAGGGKARHKVIQRIGRGLRRYEGKEYLPVFDFMDDHSAKYLEHHSWQRLQAVKNAGFTHQELTPNELMGRIGTRDIRSSRGTDR